MTVDDYITGVFFGLEGIFSSHPDDRGGSTQYGISKRFLDSIGWSGDLTAEKAAEIIEVYFWDANECGRMNTAVAWLAVDAYIQHQQPAATRMLQAALGVKQDGIRGPKTMRAARSPANVRRVIYQYMIARIRHYDAIVDSDATQRTFLDGWHMRLHILHRAMYEEGLVLPKKEKTSMTPTQLSLSAGGIIATVTGIMGSLGIGVDSVGQFIQSVFPTSAVAGLIGGILVKIGADRARSDK